jgi:orotate phosphoribosyltransferase
MTENEIIEIFRKHSAVLEGHFILSSGLHSDRYVQCALVLQHPGVAEQLGSLLAEKLRHLRPAVVAAPALGGILVAHEVARALGARALFTERQEGAMTLRRGFSLAPGEPTLVVEDVITTGLSTRETIQCVEQAGGKVVGTGALIDRSGGAADLGLPAQTSLPRAALVTLRIQNYNPADCPLCKVGIPAVKPGSRTKK